MVVGPARRGHVKEFIRADYRKEYNTYPTARSWFGFAGLHALALGAEKRRPARWIP